mmetsp:Transcript_47448/g.122801  ORF Transcript_47448/g.122801 Transcript_47448/m.122801 type:complete len:257 (+) Transcript_47448:222-992(+)
MNAVVQMLSCACKRKEERRVARRVEVACVVPPHVGLDVSTGLGLSHPPLCVSCLTQRCGRREVGRRYAQREKAGKTLKKKRERRTIREYLFRLFQNDNNEKKIEIYIYIYLYAAVFIATYLHKHCITCAPAHHHASANIASTKTQREAYQYAYNKGLQGLVFTPLRQVEASSGCSSSSPTFCHLHYVRAYPTPAPVRASTYYLLLSSYFFLFHTCMAPLSGSSSLSFHVVATRVSPSPLRLAPLSPSKSLLSVKGE